MAANYSNYSRMGSNWNNGGAYQNQGGRNSNGNLVEVEEIEVATITDHNANFVVRLVILSASDTTDLIKISTVVDQTMLETLLANQAIRDKAVPMLVRLKKNCHSKMPLQKPCLPVLMDKVETAGILTQEQRIMWQKITIMSLLK